MLTLAPRSTAPRIPENQASGRASFRAYAVRLSAHSTNSWISRTQHRRTQHALGGVGHARGAGTWVWKSRLCRTWRLRAAYDIGKVGIPGRYLTKSPENWKRPNMRCEKASEYGWAGAPHASRFERAALDICIIMNRSTGRASRRIEDTEVPIVSRIVVSNRCV